MSTETNNQIWEPVIGLEIHVQLSTESKIFSNAPTEFGIEQNLQASIIDLGLPRVLPCFKQKSNRNGSQIRLLNKCKNI